MKKILTDLITFISEKDDCINKEEIKDVLLDSVVEDGISFDDNSLNAYEAYIISSELLSDIIDEDDFDEIFSNVINEDDLLLSLSNLYGNEFYYEETMQKEIVSFIVEKICVLDEVKEIEFISKEILESYEDIYDLIEELFLSKKGRKMILNKKLEELYKNAVDNNTKEIDTSTGFLFNTKGFEQDFITALIKEI